MSAKRLFIAVFCGAVFLSASRFAASADKALDEKSSVSLIELKIDADAIIARVKKAGLAFAPDEAALKRLADVGASKAVLQALREAGSAKTPTGGEKAITFEDIVKLLELGIDEAGILKRLEKSPTVFVF